ncbi:MAG: dockerin type I domain-containing protein [Lacipirellulaceae bacterium]
MEPFSPAETAYMELAWRQMSEDFSPFNVDVTTIEPPQSWFTNSLPTGERALRVVFTSSVDDLRVGGTGATWNSDSGLAELGSWNKPNSSDSPVFVFANKFNGTPLSNWPHPDVVGPWGPIYEYMGTIGSHEVGHAFGLSHDGVNPINKLPGYNGSSSYYGGHTGGATDAPTSWGTIMGGSELRSLTQWSKGEYRGATNGQDDLAIIASQVGYRTDDHGNNLTIGSATSVALVSNVAVASGVIERSSSTVNDLDVFRLDVGPTPVRTTIRIDTPGGVAETTYGYRVGVSNLDVEMKIYASGNPSVPIATVNPADETNAVHTFLGSGVYYVVVDGVGKGPAAQVGTGTGYSDYGSLGQYTLSAARLIGDYSRDGVVNAADYTFWRDRLGQTVSRFSGADGNGDGTVNAADYTVWQAAYGSSIPASAAVFFAALAAADFNDNGWVDDFDHVIWQKTFGSTTDLRADANSDGVIDLRDFTEWQDLRVPFHCDLAGDYNDDDVIDDVDHGVWFATLGSTTDLRADGNDDGVVNAADLAVWQSNKGVVGCELLPYLSAYPALAGASAEGAPRVTEVFVSNSLFPSSPFQMSWYDGSGQQLLSVPAARDTVSVQFSEEVFVSKNALQLVNLDGATPAGSVRFEYDRLSRVASWRFLGGVFADGRYLIRLSDSVIDMSRASLDGEFTNPWAVTATGTSTFPSGNGSAGGEFRFRFTVLAGDTDRDNQHNGVDYRNWKSIEPGMVYVSTTADDWDGDLSFGDVSLREAVNHANGAGGPTTVVLPTGRYTLSRTGTETTASASVNDLDVLGDVAIVGYGPGFSIIDNSGLTTAPNAQGRAFEVNGVGKRLSLGRLTVANGASMVPGQVVYATAGAAVVIEDSAIVNHTAYTGATAVYASGSSVTISRSVFSNNDVTANYGGAAVVVYAQGPTPASITVGETIFAQNVQVGYYGVSTRYGVQTVGSVTKVNNGKNLFDFAGGGFFDTTPGVGDFLGTPTYVVTSARDTFNHADNLEALSLREAIDLANNASVASTIWVPAWKFTLTRERMEDLGNGPQTDTDVAWGDLDVKKSMSIRGVTASTSVAWKPDVIDAVFDLLGDYDGDGVAGGAVNAGDYTAWAEQLGSVGKWEQFSADGDDDGDVDAADHAIWSLYYGNTLSLLNV